MLYNLKVALRWEPPCTGVSTPPSPEIPKKSQKGLPGPPRSECQKSVEKVLKDFFMKKSQKGVKISVRDFFETFLTLRAGRPGNTFLRVFGDFGARVWRLLYMAVPIARLTLGRLGETFYSSTSQYFTSPDGWETISRSELMILLWWFCFVFCYALIVLSHSAENVSMDLKLKTPQLLKPRNE